MLRICFNRRNKTMRASWLGNKEVLKLLERNYRLYCATKNIPIDDSIAEGDDEDDDIDEMEMDENMEPTPGDEDEWGGIMDVDGAGAGAGVGAGGGDIDDLPSFFDEMKAAGALIPKTKSRHKKTKVALLIKEKVRKVLEDTTELAEQRSGKLEENDFLRLLHAFNEEGIHFS